MDIPDGITLYVVLDDGRVAKRFGKEGWDREILN